MIRFFLLWIIFSFINVSIFAIDIAENIQPHSKEYKYHHFAYDIGSRESSSEVVGYDYEGFQFIYNRNMKWGNIFFQTILSYKDLTIKNANDGNTFDGNIANDAETTNRSLAVGFYGSYYRDNIFYRLGFRYLGINIDTKRIEGEDVISGEGLVFAYGSNFLIGKVFAYNSSIRFTRLLKIYYQDNFLGDFEEEVMENRLVDIKVDRYKILYASIGGILDWQLSKSSHGGSKISIYGLASYNFYEFKREDANGSYGGFDTLEVLGLDEDPVSFNIGFKWGFFHRNRIFFGVNYNARLNSVSSRHSIALSTKYLF